MLSPLLRRIPEACLGFIPTRHSARRPLSCLVSTSHTELALELSRCRYSVSSTVLQCLHACPIVYFDIRYLSDSLWTRCS